MDLVVKGILKTRKGCIYVIYFNYVFASVHALKKKKKVILYLKIQ